MHPAIYRIFMAFCAISATVIFLVILVKVADKGSVNEFCSTPQFHEYPCWDWKFDESSSTCMFNLLFAATVCLETVILIFFTSAFLKCLFPEFAIVSQRSLFCRFMSRYLSVALNLTSTTLSLSFILFTLIHRNSSQSCYQFADLINSCIANGRSCLLFVLLLLGFVFSILATMFSAWDARLWHVIRREDEERERIYQNYVEYNSIEEVNNY